jgi:hypothetical protein
MDRPIALAAVVHAVTAAYGSRVALREDVLGEPLGISPPGRVATHLVAGWGAGVGPPWPMPVAVLTLALRPGPRAGTVCTGLGALLLAGQLVEPVAWGRRPSSPAVTRAMAFNLLAGSVLVLAGRRSVLATR